MEFRIGSLDFTAPVSGSGPRTASSTVVFPRAVTNQVAALTGYWMGYAQSAGDHHVGRLVAEAASVVDDNTVTVTATLGVRDWSGDWDDLYQGTVDFAILAELEPATGPAVLTGFDVEYSHGDDHHLGRLDVQLEVGAINGADVAVTVTYGLRDWSDNWDDGYDGTVSFAVIGE
jgi:hypothetical protein